MEALLFWYSMHLGRFRRQCQKLNGVPVDRTLHGNAGGFTYGETLKLSSFGVYLMVRTTRN